jgi:hypothetical protein
MASHCRRDVLSSLRRLRAHVGVADMLRITLRHLDHIGRHFDELPSCLLLPAPTFVAHRERDLVRSPPFVPRAAEDLTRQEQNRSIIVER